MRFEHRWAEICGLCEAFNVSIKRHSFKVSFISVVCPHDHVKHGTEMILVFTVYGLHIGSQVESEHLLPLFFGINVHFLPVELVKLILLLALKRCLNLLANRSLLWQRRLRFGSRRLSQSVN